MGKIHLLDEQISSRIAAGEVIERPASIIKELVENAIDAQATAVSIQITEGGIKKISVTDNGSGIAYEDMALAMQKHATSKIYSIKDLDAIYSMGFRGEALSSMAAVSMMKIRSRVPGSETGAEVSARGGEIFPVKQSGTPEGTNVTIENLFYNTPARLKFLKKPGTEAARVTDIVGKLILAYPAVAMKYTSNGEVLLNSPGSGELIDAIMTVYGHEVKNQVLPVSASIDECLVSGYINKPAFSYKTQRGQAVYINHRYIQSRLIQNAVIQGFGQRILKGNYPFYCLHFNIPFEDVDVNVHPNKLQVHFRDESKIEYLVLNAVSQAIEKYQSAPELRLDEDRRVFPAQIEKIPTRQQEEEDLKEEYLQPASREEIYKAMQEIRDLSQKDEIPYIAAQIPDYSKEFPQREVSEVPAYELDETEEESEQLTIPQIQELPPNYTLHGTVFGTYIMVEAGDILYFIDQHASHERLVYEQFKKEVSAQSVVTQPLLVPEVIKVGHEDSLLLEDSMEILNQLGIEIAEFGPMTFKVSAIPVLFGDLNVQTLIDELLAELRTHPAPKDLLLRRERLIKHSCRMAIKAGDVLSTQETEFLIREILTSDSIPYCPHGRPIAIAMRKEELEKGFRRKV